MKVKGVQNSQSMGDTKEKPCFISQYPIRKDFLFFVCGKEELSGKIASVRMKNLGWMCSGKQPQAPPSLGHQL